MVGTVRYCKVQQVSILIVEGLPELRDLALHGFS